MEKSITSAKERFLTTNLETGQDMAIRLMDARGLAKCHAELKRQYEACQVEFVEAMNRQLTLRSYIAAIEFEQERRGSQN
jgi:hypothetical protein